MTKIDLGDALLFNAPMEDVLPTLDHADHILTDPPYLYIKTHDFDREFDETLLFENARRILPDNGFIALFGRGTSFYRWNTRLAELGFIFKEEIVWDKRYTTAPCIALSRVHETATINSIKNGMKEKSLIYSPVDNGRTGTVVRKDFPAKDRARCTLEIISGGMREKSVIELGNSHYGLSHPTEKPVRLAERILALISDPGDIIYDPFMGSGSFSVACLNTGRKYIGSEIISEYYEIAYNRIKKYLLEKGTL